MKYHILEVSLALLIGSTCLGADTHMAAVRACQATLASNVSASNATLASDLAADQGYFDTCTSAFSSGTTFGGCLTSAYNTDCKPFNSDGSCKNFTVYNNDYIACQTLYLGPNGNDGVCANVKTTEDNIAYSNQQTRISGYNQADATCEGQAPSPGACNSSTDCTGANFDTGIDQGPNCVNGACKGDDPPPDDGGGGGGGGNQCGGDDDESPFYDSVPDGGSCSYDTDCEDENDYCDPDECVCTSDDYEDPILIDLSGAGYLLTDIGNGVTFDMKDNGKARQLAWTATGAEVGFLALDRNGNGNIDNGSELFTGFSPQPSPQKPRVGSRPASQTTSTPGVVGISASMPRTGPRRSGGRTRKTGFAALAMYDQPALGGNGDGQIDAADAVFSMLLVWVDTNHDGVSQPGELHTLAELGITSISTNYQSAAWTDVYGNKFSSRTQFVRNGAAHWADDVYLMAVK